MPNFIKKFLAGNTSSQIKARNRRFQKRKRQIEGELGGAAIQLEFETLDDMLRAFYAEGGPTVSKPTLIQSYILDWRRKEKHGGTQSWYALCDLGEVVQSVVWTLTDRDKSGGLVQGGKIYDMRTTGVEDIIEALHL